MTPDEARDALRARAGRERPEERDQPPSWSPAATAHHHREPLDAHEAARSRAEHALRLLDLPDGALSLMLADGWRPSADNARYVG